MLISAAPLWSAPAADAVPPHVVTLAEALEFADATAPTVEAADAGVRAAEAQRRVAGLRPNPSFVSEIENFAGSGIYQGTQSVEATLGISLPIELGGKRAARMGVAAAGSGRARIDSEIAAADLRLRVTQSYTEALAADRRVVATTEQVVVADEALNAARARVAAGRASPLEAQRGELVLINAETDKARAVRTATLAHGNLSRLIGWPAAALDTAWFDHVRPALRRTDPATTLSAAAASKDVSAAEARIALARSQRVSDVTISAGARWLEQTNDTAAIFGVTIPLAIFNGGRANVDVATAERDRAEALRRAALLDAERDVATAEADLANATDAARVATGPGLAAATEAARIARIGYREGKFGQLDLLEAERSLLLTRTAAIDALAAYHDAVARLERLTTPSSAYPDNDR